jgi:hypothetical protein
VPRHGALSRWRDGGSPEDWPTGWTGANPDKWPRLAPHTWTPDHAGGAVIVCVRRGDNGSGSVFTGYPDRAAAALDDAKRDGCCSAGCLGRHVIVWTEPGRVRVLPGVHDAPVVPAEPARALWDAGYRPPFGATTASRPAAWPAPSYLNTRLGPPPSPERTDR